MPAECRRDRGGGPRPLVGDVQLHRRDLRGGRGRLPGRARRLDPAAQRRAPRDGHLAAVDPHVRWGRRPGLRPRRVARGRGVLVRHRRRRGRPPGPAGAHGAAGRGRARLHAPAAGRGTRRVDAVGVVPRRDGGRPRRDRRAGPRHLGRARRPRARADRVPPDPPAGPAGADDRDRRRPGAPAAGHRPGPARTAGAAGRRSRVRRAVGAVGARRAGRRRRAARPDARDAVGVPLRRQQPGRRGGRAAPAQEHHPVPDPPGRGGAGRPLQDDRLDVEVALLACRLLGSTVLRPVPAADR